MDYYLSINDRPETKHMHEPYRTPINKRTRHVARRTRAVRTYVRGQATTDVYMLCNDGRGSGCQFTVVVILLVDTQGATGTGASKTLAKLRRACACVGTCVGGTGHHDCLVGMGACIKIRSIPSSSSSVSHY